MSYTGQKNKKVQNAQIDSISYETFRFGRLTCRIIFFFFYSADQSFGYISLWGSFAFYENTCVENSMDHVHAQICFLE